MEATSPDRETILKHLETRLHHRFKNADLATEALTHSSAKEKDLPCNERLEFLGDAILGHVVSEYLFQCFPGRQEGELSTMKSVIVSAGTLAARAQELELDRILILGRGLAEKRALPRSILCNVYESVVAALYLDAGFEKAREFILRTLRITVDEILKDAHEKNYKSLLQDYAQRETASVPSYRVTSESGPDHKKMFEIVVELAGKRYGPGRGASKKEAEQRVARLALGEMGLLGDDAGPES